MMLRGDNDGLHSPSLFPSKALFPGGYEAIIIPE